MIARGAFEVTLTPLDPHESTIARMAIDKQFHGNLEATSKGEMLASRSDIKGSAGYVAIERVTGSLDGRTGGFVLQHTGVMNRGEPQLTVVVIPDSGTGELVGLSGQMTIEIADGNHSYVFDYTLAESS